MPGIDFSRPRTMIIALGATAVLVWLSLGLFPCSPCGGPECC